MTAQKPARPLYQLEPQIWSSVIRNLQLPLADTGLDTRRLLGAAGIDAHALEHPHGQVPLSRYLQSMNLAADWAKDPLIGIKLTRNVGPEILGAVGFLFLTARTLVDALSQLCHYQQLFQDSTSLQFLRRGGEYLYTYSIYDIHNLDVRQDVEFSLAYTLRLIRLFGNPEAEIIRMTFRHAPSVAVRHYERALGVPCYFHQTVNSLVLKSEGLQERGHRHDPNLEQILTDYLNHDIEEKQGIRSNADWIKQTIRNEVGHKLVTADHIASRLGLSTSSLYRRLREENTTFGVLADEVYFDLAQRYLRETKLSIAQIGETLGFSSPSSFTRAFTQWSGGLTPRQARAATRL